MEVFTTGFAQKSAQQFFDELRGAGIQRILDVRLNNTSQLAGFTKRSDLPYFLKEICGADYVHEPLLAPSQELFEGYKKRGGSWEDYEQGFFSLMAERRVEEHIPRELFTVPTALLCSEHTADRCHRRLILEYLASKWGDLHISHI